MKNQVMKIKETDAKQDLINTLLDDELEKKIITAVLKFKTTQEQIDFLLGDGKK